MIRTDDSPPAAARRIPAVALAIVVAAVAALLLTGGSTYTIHARLLDASGLVGGDLVEVAGNSVGSVSGLGVTANGQADVQLSISDQSIVPLHVGTRAIVRALGQAGVANHYVQLTLGPNSAPALASGSVLGTDQTTSMVPLDAVFDSFGPSQRANLQQMIADAADVYAGSGARTFNHLLDGLNPAAAQLANLTDQLAGDRIAITNVIHNGSVAAGAIASRSADLGAAVVNTARTLGALASQRTALADALTRAPGVLDQATGTLANLGTALIALRPTLREVPPLAQPLGAVLERIDLTLPEATPVIAQLRGELPGLRASLAGLKQLAPLAVPALRSAGTALKVARPITQAVRYYGSDLLLGVFQGLAAVGLANYDRWGHYARIEFTQPYQTALGGPLTSLLKKPLAPSLFNLRTGLDRRCPGGNAPPAPDGSNPWVLPASICTAADDTPLSVDFP